MPDTQLGKLVTAVATLTDEVSGLRREVHELTAKVEETKEIVEAWGAMKTAGKFVKWFATIIASLAAIAIGVKLGITHLLKG